MERNCRTGGRDLASRRFRDPATGRCVADWLSRLHGKKHLVTGNNDPPDTTGQAGWASVQPYAEMTLDGVLLVLCHYPFRSWRRMDKGSLNLHGHCHGRLKPQPRQVDVGVDVWDFRPVTLGQILKPKDRLKQRL